MWGILTLVVAIIVFADRAPAADLWKEVAQKAWEKHGKDEAYDFVRDEVKAQITQWLNNMKSLAGPEYAEYMNALGHGVITAQNLDELIKAQVTGNPVDMEKAAADLATTFGRQIAAIAEKKKDLGAGLLQKLAGNSKKVKEISTALGAATGGDFKQAFEFIGTELLEFVSPASGPWVKVFQAAYGSMKFVRDVYVESTMEELYQGYKKVLDEHGPARAEAWVHERFTVGGDQVNALRTRMSEIRKEREEALAETGLRGPRMKDVVSEAALIRNIVESMQARRQKESAAARIAEVEKEAAKRAKHALEILNDEMILRHGKDWWNSRTFTPEMLDKFLAEVERLIKEHGLSLEEAARLQAYRLAHGLNSDKVREFIKQIKEERKRADRKPVIISGHAGTLTKVRPFGDASPDSKPFGAGTVLTTVGGSWQRKELADPDKVYGPFVVPHGGKLRAELTGDPPVPAEWSLYNSNTGMTITFEPLLEFHYGPKVQILRLSGETTANKLSGEATWPGPGRITVACSPARGSGPLLGCQFRQSFTGQVVVKELIPNTAPKAGTHLDPGDQLTLGIFGETILRVGGSKVRAGKNADLKLKLRDDEFGGKPYLEQRDGRVRVVNPTSLGSKSVPPVGLELTLKGTVDPKTKALIPGPIYTIDARGTDYECELWEGKSGRITVYQGAVVVRGGNGPDTWLNAGQTMELPRGDIGEVLLSRDRGCLVENALRLDEVPVDTSPQPYGNIEGRFDGGRLGGEWVWQDPGNDATLETPQPGTLKISVPDNNDLWSKNNQSPRFLHKVTGDFDFSAEVLVECKGLDNANFDFLIFSPGSYQGYRVDQFHYDGILAHYRKLGGWLKQQGMNKLGALHRVLRDAPDAPDRPVKFRLTRRDDLWKGYWSLDGKEWTLFLRETIKLPDTLWVGCTFNRMAWDRLLTEKGVFTLRDVRITTATRGTMPMPEWDFVQAEGTANGSGKTIQLALNGSKLGEVSAMTPFQIVGDLDVMVKFTLPPVKRQPGESAVIQLTASTENNKQLAYIALVRSDATSQRYATDLKAQDRWGFGYQFAPTQDNSGALRLVRQGETWSAYFWIANRWVQLDKKFTAGFADPVYVSALASNKHEARKPAPLRAEFTFTKLPGTADGKIDHGPDKVERGRQPAGHIVGYPKILQFQGDYRYDAYQDAVVLRDNASGAEGAVWIDKPGRQVKGAFRATLDKERNVAERLGEALSEETPLFDGAVHIQIFQGGAMMWEKRSGATWWGYHERRKPVAVALPDDPRAIVVSLDQAGGLTLPRKDKNPLLVIRADGSVTVTDPFGGKPPTQTKIKPEQLQDLMRFIVVERDAFGLESAALAQAVTAERKRKGLGQVTDFYTTVLRVRTAEKEHEVRCYALPIYAEQLNNLKALQQLRDVEKRLEKLIEEVRPRKKSRDDL